MEPIAQQVAAVVVLYHPDEQLVRRMETYAAVGLLMAYCNSNLTAGLRSTLSNKFPQLVFLNDGGRNEGIGKALNAAAALALNKDCAYLLTMDQDSDFGDAFDGFLALADEAFAQPAVAMTGPVIASPAHKSGWSKAPYLITSGSILKLDWWKKAGPFVEEWMIDEVDHEYCYRLRKLGAELWQTNAVRLAHKLGNETHTRLGSRRTYGPLRTFFSVRNFLQLEQLYGSDFPEEFARRKSIQRNQWKNNLLYGNQFFAVLRAIWQGWLAYRRQDFSRRLDA